MIPLLLVEIVIEACQFKLRVSDEELNDLEEKAGQHEHPNRPRGDPLEMDFGATTRKINFIGKRVDLNLARLHLYQHVLEKLAEFKDDILQGSACVQGSLEVLGSRSEVEDKLAYLLDMCRILSVQAEYERKRVAILTQGVRPIALFLAKAHNSH
jgi:hypothetical protein